MIRHCLGSILCLLPYFSLAETPMSAAEFDAYTQGKTIFYSQNGEMFGAEEYYANRRVRWSLLDGACIEGHWFSDGPQICFLYEERSTPHCWHFFAGPKGLSAQLIDEDPLAFEIIEEPAVQEPHICLGPEVGV